VAALATSSPSPSEQCSPSTRSSSETVSSTSTTRPCTPLAVAVPATLSPQKPLRPSRTTALAPSGPRTLARDPAPALAARRQGFPRTAWGVALIGFGRALPGLDLPLRFETARVEEEGFNDWRKEKAYVCGVFWFVFSFFLYLMGIFLESGAWFMHGVEFLIFSFFFFCYRYRYRLEWLICFCLSIGI